MKGRKISRTAGRRRYLGRRARKDRNERPTSVPFLHVGRIL
jgi:hypothetical protein